MKQWRIATRQQVEADYKEILSTIAEDSLQAAEKFRLAFRETSSLLSIAPESGSPRYFENPTLQGLRFFPLKGFENYLLFYRPLKDEETVEIVRIIHGARADHPWSMRLTNSF